MSDLVLTAPAAGAASGVRRATAMAVRCLRLSARTVDAMLTALFLPIMLLLMFVYLFGGAIRTGTAYLTYVVPGILLLCAGFGASMTAVSVSHDMKSGIIDRFRSMDVGGASILGGHVVASVARNLVSTALVFGLAFVIGFRAQAQPLRWLGAIGVLVLFILAISWLSAAVGLVARSPEGAGGFTFFVMFLPYPSSAFVPIDTMPSWIHGFAGNQPVTAVTETMRALLFDQPSGTHPWRAVLWCLGILGVSLVLSATLFRSRVR